jgi:hypothetical protein
MRGRGVVAGLGLNRVPHGERSALATRHLDGAENWLRRLVHFELQRRYGDGYLSKAKGVRKNTIEFVEAKGAATHVNMRDVDATTFGQLVAIVRNPELFEHFGEALRRAYPPGREVAGHYLNQLVSIRNHIAHGNAASVRQLEKAICYSNDLAEGLLGYFAEIGMLKEFDVPTIVRFVDSLGNESRMHGVPTDLNSRIIDWRLGPHGVLHPGDTLMAEIEIDPAFAAADYVVTWDTFGGQLNNGPIAEFDVNNAHVGEQLELRFNIVTNRDWHRAFGRDEALTLLYRVLPPI